MIDTTLLVADAAKLFDSRPVMQGMHRRMRLGVMSKKSALRYAEKMLLAALFHLQRSDCIMAEAALLECRDFIIYAERCTL